MAEEREVPQQQVQDFLLREFGLFLWLDEALVEDDELHQCIASGSPALETMLKDGLRLCKLVRLIDPDCAPVVKENEKAIAYKCRQNIQLFLEACEELGVPVYHRFTVSDLWDETNLDETSLVIVSVLNVAIAQSPIIRECVEKLAEVADAMWNFPFKLKSKQQLIAETSKTFTKAHQQRATEIVRKRLKQTRASVFIQSPISAIDSLRARFTSVPEKPGEAASGPTRINLSVPGILSPAVTCQLDLGAKRQTRLQQQQTADDDLLNRGIVRIQSLYRGHRARKRFRQQLRLALRTENVAREIYKTEHSYVFNLRLLVHCFLSRMDAMQWQVKGGSPIEMEKMKILSRQIQPILGFNKKLIDEYLEPRMQNWNFHSKLGDIFVQISAFLKLYCDYVNNYGPALQELIESRKKSSALDSFLTNQRAIPRELAMPRDDILGPVNPYLSSPDLKLSLAGPVGDIADYLIQPIQRIPRYLLLLNELLKYTEPSHRDYEELGQALKGIREVTEFIEAQTIRAENVNKLASIQSRLLPVNQIVHSLGVPPLLSINLPHRKFLREGKVLIKHKKDMKDRVLILFNDLLLNTKPKLGKSKLLDECALLIKQAIDLSEVSAMSSKMAVDEHTFLVVNEDTQSQDVLLEVCCSSKMERYDWITAIHGAKRQLAAQIPQREPNGKAAGAAAAAKAPVPRLIALPARSSSPNLPPQQASSQASSVQHSASFSPRLANVIGQSPQPSPRPGFFLPSPLLSPRSSSRSSPGETSEQAASAPQNASTAPLHPPQLLPNVIAIPSRSGSTGPSSQASPRDSGRSQRPCSPRAGSAIGASSTGSPQASPRTSGSSSHIVLSTRSASSPSGLSPQASPRSSFPCSPSTSSRSWNAAAPSSSNEPPLPSSQSNSPSLSRMPPHAPPANIPSKPMILLGLGESSRGSAIGASSTGSPQASPRTSGSSRFLCSPSVSPRSWNAAAPSSSNEPPPNSPNLSRPPPYAPPPIPTDIPSKPMILLGLSETPRGGAKMDSS